MSAAIDFAGLVAPGGRANGWELAIFNVHRANDP